MSVGRSDVFQNLHTIDEDVLDRYNLIHVNINTIYYRHPTYNAVWNRQMDHLFGLIGCGFDRIPTDMPHTLSNYYIRWL